MITQAQNLESYEKLNLWIPKVVECLDATVANEHIAAFAGFVANLFYWVAAREGKADVALDRKVDLSHKINKHLKIDKEFPPVPLENNTDLVNAVNYVSVWVKNNCDIDIDNANISEIQKKNFAKLEALTSNKKDGNTASSIYKNLLNKNISDESVDEIKKGINVFSEKAGRTQLEKEIQDGKIYIYKTKPKWNPVFKSVLCFLFGVGFLVSIVWFMFAFATVFSGNSSNNVWSILVSVINMLFFVYSIVETIKKNGNDNFKYLFDKSLLIYQFFAFLIHTAFSALNAGTLEVPSNQLSVSMIALHAVSLGINAYGIFSLNPVKDDKLINDLSSKYSEDESQKKSNTEVE